MCSRNSVVLQNHAELLLPFFFLGAAKLVVAVAVFLLTFYVISQVFEIKMDASLGNLFGKFHRRPFTSLPLLLPLAPHVPSSFTSLCFSTHLVQASSLLSLGLFTGAWAPTPLKKMALPSTVAVKFQWLLRKEYYLADSSPSMMGY